MLSQIIRFFVKLILMVFGLVFAISLLVAALFVVLLSLIKSLITGKKPSSVMAFSRFKKFSPSITWTSALNPAGHRDENLKAPSTGEIVDVEVREIKDTKDVERKDS